MTALGIPRGGLPAAEAALQGLNLPLPAPGLSAVTGTHRLIRLSPDQLLLIGPPPETDTLYSADQTDAFAALDLSGPDALPALERLCTLDLAALQVHAAPRSLMAHLSVILIRLAPDAFRLMSARSSAKSFAHSIRTALSAVT